MKQIWYSSLGRELTQQQRWWVRMRDTGWTPSMSQTTQLSSRQEKTRNDKKRGLKLAQSGAKEIRSKYTRDIKLTEQHETRNVWKQPPNFCRRGYGWMWTVKTGGRNLARGGKKQWVKFQTLTKVNSECNYFWLVFGRGITRHEVLELDCSIIMSKWLA